MFVWHFLCCFFVYLLFALFEVLSKINKCKFSLVCLLSFFEGFCLYACLVLVRDQCVYPTGLLLISRCRFNYTKDYSRIISLCQRQQQQQSNEGPEGVKWELGLACFCPGKIGFRSLGMGFGLWEWEKKCQKWEWDKYFVTMTSRDITYFLGLRC